MVPDSTTYPGMFVWWDKSTINPSSKDDGSCISRNMFEKIEGGQQTPWCVAFKTQADALTAIQKASEKLSKEVR